MTRQSSSLVAVVDSLPACQVVLIPDVSQVQGLNDDDLWFASATKIKMKLLVKALLMYYCGAQQYRTPRLFNKKFRLRNSAPDFSIS